MKRIMDISISLILLMLFSPLLLIVGAIVRISLGSPILFTQLRPGLHEKPFKLYKLRTMLDIKDIDGNLLEDELRLTVIGRFIRKTSLDEFPQLFNVMKGDMSLVGPRPLLMEYLSEYTEEQKMRHYVKPGITGWAQVNGRNAISWEEKFKLDIWYVINQSLLLDIKILFLTLVKVVKSEGISNGKHATMPIFRGEREYEG